ncbi:MAG TPA: ABC transporter permease [Roseiflexaceae bacterium]|nr:ABC transporter permease [Roseiflexaceae bacterium]HMP40208.1 ABC transporter permease [Roseiflexaceae bacterium]
MATILSARRRRIGQLLNPLAAARHLWRQRELIAQFTRREIEGRYRGSFLGLFWSLAQPLFMLAIYTIIFGVVFRSRWPQARSESLAEFALTVFAGLIAYTLFSESVGRAAGLIVGVPNYVKKVVFPLEILPFSVVGAALFHLLVSIVVLIAAQLVLVGSLPWTIIFLPLVLLPLLCFSLGMMWLIASLGVFVRDIGQLVAIVLQGLFFFTPIFYSIDMIPEPLRSLILINPMAPITENFRRVLLWGTLPSFAGLGLWLLATLGFMLLGYAWFMQTKKAFADVL